MKGKLKEYQGSRLLAHVLPLGAFMVLTSLVGWVEIPNDLLPWYRHAPEQWIYPVQCLVCGALLFFFRQHYDFKPVKGLWFASAMAILGIAVWVLPAELFDRLNLAAKGEDQWFQYLGLQDREEGFNAEFFRDETLLYWAAIGARFFRMVIIVALVEEIFWRGFLMRFLMDMDSWEKVPFGAYKWSTVIIIVVLFILIHQPADYFGAFVYGSLACWVAIRTKSLFACVWMHAIANLILGLYIMWSRNWGLW